MTEHKDTKIVQVIRRIHAFGGAAAVAHHLGEAFTSLGLTHSVVSLASKPLLIKSRWIEKVRLFFDVVLFSMSGSLKLRALRKKEPNSIVIVHGDALGGDIYIDHGLHREVVWQKPHMIFRNPIHLFLLGREWVRHRFPSYRFIVVLSQYSRRILAKHYPYIPAHKIIQIPNGIDLAKFTVPHREKDLSKLRLIFVGHEYERKGLKFAIDALVNLPEPVTLTVVGGSSEEIASHKRQAASIGVGSRVTFLGKRLDVAAVMSEHDFLILPSRFEAWQLVVLEAMAAGLPVLCTPVGCAEEVIVDGKTGYIIERSSESIVNKLAPVLEQPSIRLEMSLASRQMAEQFSWEQIARRYVALCEIIIAERDTDR